MLNCNKIVLAFKMLLMFLISKLIFGWYSRKKKQIKSTTSRIYMNFSNKILIFVENSSQSSIEVSPAVQKSNFGYSPSLHKEHTGSDFSLICGRPFVILVFGNRMQTSRNTLLKGPEDDVANNFRELFTIRKISMLCFVTELF